jgi:hypothetical protein
MRIWEQRLERSEYEVSRSARQYHAVDPENRLVARELERQWEEKLHDQQRLQENFRRFESRQVRGLTERERQEIRRLATNIPALWRDSATTDQERKTILRAVIDRVIVNPQGDSERVELRIEWVGGSTTEHEVIRPVARLEQLSHFDELCQRVRTLVAREIPAREIAEHLNKQGFRPTNPRKVFNAQMVARLMRKLGLVSKQASAHMAHREVELGEHEWTVPGLARKIGMPEGTLRMWMERGWIRGRRERPGPRSRWILWADEEAIAKLRERRERGADYYSQRRWVEEVDREYQKTVIAR